MKIALIYNKGARAQLGERVQRVLRQYSNLDIQQFDLKEVQKINNHFDLYLRIGGDNYETIPDHLHPVGWRVIDTHLEKPYKIMKKMIRDYDYIFCAQKNGAINLSKDTDKETFWVPMTTDEVPVNFRLTAEKDKSWDICFVGTTGKYSLRKVVLEQLCLNYSNLFMGRVDPLSLRDYYSKARIVVNYPIRNDINPRIFEAMGSGALVVTHRIINNGFSELFQEGKHLVVFDDIFSDMKRKIDYYLNNPEERNLIAQAGFEHVKKYHTFRQRLERIFFILGVNLEKRN